MENLISLWASSGIAQLQLGQLVMMTVGLTLLFLAISKGFEPLLLVPIGFGTILANIPGAGFDAAPIYDLIIGIESLAKLGAILNFADQSITIDHVVLPMKPHDQLMDPKVLQAQFQAPDEPASTRDATKRAVEILDAKYEKANVVAIVTSTCKHLTSRQQQMLIELLLEFEPLFDGTLGDWNTKPATFKLKKDAKPYHGRAFPVPHIHLQVLKREVEQLVRLGVLKRQPDSEWGSSAFIIPKKNGQVRFISDFREVNKRIIRTPYPIPKIATVLQQMEGFTFATSLDLIMGYYTIRLDSDAQKICTIILPWGNIATCVCQWESAVQLIYSKRKCLA